MPYGKQTYDPEKDVYTCEFPIHEKDGSYRICNKVCQDLVRHITRHHGITSAEYKKMLGLNKSESLMSKRTRDKLRKNKEVQKGWANLKPIPFKPGENEIQSYTRSPQNRSRLRRLHLHRKSNKKIKLKNNT